MQVLCAGDRPAVPWKNGGGLTREIAAWPAGSSLEDFDWRVSMAEVRADGPFSVFPGVDRVLAVLEGRLRLAVEGRTAVTLTPDDAPAAFPGDVAVHALVEAGPVLDLNVMSRRGRVRVRLDRVDILAPQIVGPWTSTVLVIAANGPLRVVGLAERCDLERHDAVLIAPGGEGLLLEATAPALAYVASLDAA